VLLERLQCRPSRRGRPRHLGRGGSLVVLVVTAGLAGGAALAERPAGSGREPPGDRVGLPRGALPIGRATAAPFPGSDRSPVPAPVPATVPAAPVAVAARPAAPAVSPPSAPVASAPIRPPSAEAQPGPRRWIASSAPLAASRPVRVDIAAVGVSAPIGPLGLNRDGTLQVPADFGRAGWYTGRPTPGETGPAVIVAHRASRRGPGAFWTLPDVQPGQEIVVTRADGRRILFTVDRVEQHRKDGFPTAEVYGPVPETALRLITCGGPFEPALGDHYRDNVIVFAHMIGWTA
jgi:hypothetical protein